MVMNLKAVPMVNLTVVMANVFQEAINVMAHLNSVMLDGVLTVPMVQMKA
jgi:hypothetical protein